MSRLAWQLNQLQNKYRDGGIGTRSNRRRILNQAANQLTKKLGFNQMNVNALKEKHANKLVSLWKSEGLSNGTIKNRMAHIRWWADKTGIRHKIPSNESLNIEKRVYVTNENKAIQLTDKHLSKVDDVFLKYSLRLQSEFGLRREESIKFKASYADKGDKIILKDTWCKGKREREIPITSNAQRALLDEIRKFTGEKSLIPIDKQYKHQMNLYRNIVTEKVIGFNKGHGLRHNYAQIRYKILSGNNCPHAGGKHQKDMSELERQHDRDIRLIISEELGHSREQITSIYLGS